LNSDLKKNNKDNSPTVGARLDLYITKNYSLSRSQVKKLIDSGEVTVNGRKVKAGHILKDADKVKIHIPPTVPAKAVPENIPLEIIYQDKDLLVAHKPAGMVTHPAPGNYSGTLVNALLHHVKDLSGIGGVERPGIVHRLDKDTDGLLLVAKNDRTHQALAAQIKAREVKRKYIALVQGIVTKEEGVISQPIGRHPGDRKKMAVTSKHSRAADTHYKVLERYKGKGQTRLELTLGTGRTHQIRVHMQYLGYPIVDDPVYAQHKGQGQKLCAYYLGFRHPWTEEWLEFKIKPGF
jgi:23S rRNA pseudouridine1911/1915/1917 synthase